MRHNRNRNTEIDRERDRETVRQKERNTDRVVGLSSFHVINVCTMMMHYARANRERVRVRVIEREREKKKSLKNYYSPRPKVLVMNNASPEYS